MLSPGEQQTLDEYNNIASEWVTINYFPDFWEEEYKKFQKFLPSGKIIDLGCGGGKDSIWFIKNGFDYFGVDISEGMIAEAAKRHPGVKFLQKDFYNLDLPKNSFDGFWSANSLLHIPKNKVALVLSNIKTVLKTGSIGFVSIKDVHDPGTASTLGVGHKRVFVYYAQEEFAKILVDAGFEILEMIVKLPGKKFHQNGTFLLYFVKLL